MNAPQPFMVRDDEAHERALAIIERLWDAEKGTPAAETRDILCVLVDAYEDVRYPIGPPDPIEAIKFRMDQMGLTQTDVAPMFGGANRVSEVLSGKRGLSLSMIRRISKGMGIPVDVLVGQGD